MSDPITVEIDEDLEDLIPGFLSKRQTDLDLIQNALDELDYSELKGIAHRIKGAGGSYGFDDLSHIASSMEQAAMAENAARVAEELDKMSDYLNRINVVYVE